MVIQKDGSFVIRMKKLLSLLVLGALAAIGHAVTVEKTANLKRIMGTILLIILTGQ